MAAYKALPEYITLREIFIRVEPQGFRTRSLVVVTTLLDALQATKDDLATLYRARWNNELDLRSISPHDRHNWTQAALTVRSPYPTFGHVYDMLEPIG